MIRGAVGGHPLCLSNVCVAVQLCAWCGQRSNPRCTRWARARLDSPPVRERTDAASASQAVRRVRPARALPGWSPPRHLTQRPVWIAIAFEAQPLEKSTGSVEGSGKWNGYFFSGLKNHCSFLLHFNNYIHPPPYFLFLTLPHTSPLETRIHLSLGHTTYFSTAHPKSPPRAYEYT